MSDKKRAEAAERCLKRIDDFVEYRIRSYAVYGIQQKLKGFLDDYTKEVGEAHGVTTRVSSKSR